MTTTEDKPVDRDAWRRLLDGETDGPPELTDARIRAKARQALTPRSSRWWLPASLAASLLLAVVLVQRQYEGPRAPGVVSESDYAAAPAEAPAPERQDEPVQDSFVLDPPTPERSIARASEESSQRPAASEREQERRTLAPPPTVPPPLIDLPLPADSRAAGVAQAEAPASAPAADAAQANAAKREEDVSEIVVSGSRIREGNVEASTPVTQVTSADVASQGQGLHAGALMKSGAAERTPEAWYADIEKLRAAGKKREAKRELEKLEEAHPGWLEEHLKKNPPKD